AIPAVMAAARAGEVIFRPDGSVELAGQLLAPDEVEVQATPRPGTAVASDEGLVVVIDTELTPELRAEGDDREVDRAFMDTRREAGLELDAPATVYAFGSAVSAIKRLETRAGSFKMNAVIVRAKPDPEKDAIRQLDLEDGHLELGVRRT